MCGICGYWNLAGEPVDDRDLVRFTDSLEHRGPDGRGTYVDPRACLGLGHRRLAILDLSEAGRQPMACGRGRYQVVFNGEIYNFIELRAQLTGLGHVFATDTDTEVIAAAFAQWGEDCQLRFNGIWAFALWDARERRLFLSRDRFGVKPAYYLSTPERFAFASESKAFLHLPWFEPVIDAAALGRGLASPETFERNGECFLAGVRKLPPGYSLRLEQGRQPVLRRWWNTLDHLDGDVPASGPGQARRFRELFFDACRIRMRSDTPLGTALSGGLDSSAVLCSMSRIAARDPGERFQSDWRKAFVALYPGTFQDEEEYARAALGKAGGKGFFVPVAPEGLPGLFDRIVYHIEDIEHQAPFGPWLVYESMRRNGVYVSLDGHGGDEILGGYHHHLPLAMADAASGATAGGRLAKLRSLYASMHPPERVFVQPGLEDLRLGRGLHPVPVGVEDYRRDASLLAGMGHLNRGLYCDLHYGTLPRILRNVDRISMAHGVEVREPFLDWRLVCYLCALPGSSKISSAWTKRLLRLGLRGVLPETIRRRASKLGFASPEMEWYRGPLKEFLLDSVNAADFLDSPGFDPGSVRATVREAYEKGAYHLLGGVEKYLMSARLPKLFRKRSP